MPIVDASFPALLERCDSVSGSLSAPAQGAAAANVVTEHKASFAEVAALLQVEKSAVAAAPTAAKQSSATQSFKFWEKEDFGFGDIVDIVNPLQHIPIVSTIYRNLTGDQIGAAPRVIGGAIWGRAGGFVAGIVNTVVEWFTGKDVGDHIYATLFGASPAAVSDAAVVQRKAPPAVGENKSGTMLPVSAPIIPESAVEASPSPAVKEGVLIESILRISDLLTDSAILEKTESELVPTMPWTAASALHVLQYHDRKLVSNEDSRAPLLRYTA